MEGSDLACCNCSVARNLSGVSEGICRNFEMNWASYRAENRKQDQSKYKSWLMVTMPLFGALCYGVFILSGLPTVLTLLTGYTQQPGVPTACIAYVSEKLSILTAIFTFCSAGVWTSLGSWATIVSLVPSVREIQGDQKFSVHLMITVQKTNKNVKSLIMIT
jgi:hypothetical protein